MQTKITIGEKEYTLNEIPYVVAIGLNVENRGETAKVLLRESAGLTDEEINNLSLKDGLQLQKAINEINGLEDFQQPKTE